jgi:hypothetical protein
VLTALKKKATTTPVGSSTASSFSFSHHRYPRFNDVTARIVALNNGGERKKSQTKKKRVGTNISSAAPRNPTKIFFFR